MPLKVLIVDDEASYRRLLDDYLTRQGFATATAGSVDQAIELSTQFEPDVLILDWMLHDHVTGLTLIPALEQAGIRPMTILISGYPISELQPEAERMNVSHCLSKPFEPAQLLAAVQQAVVEQACSQT